MSKNYPVIGRTDKHDKNTSAPCIVCREIGKRKVHLEFSYMRGEDEVVWACLDHYRDRDALVDAYAKECRER